MSTKIVACSCKHEFQDSKYGKGKRVHNACNSGWSCTVCSNSKNAASEGKKK